MATKLEMLKTAAKEINEIRVDGEPLFEHQISLSGKSAAVVTKAIADEVDGELFTNDEKHFTPATWKVLTATMGLEVKPFVAPATTAAGDKPLADEEEPATETAAQKKARLAKEKKDAAAKKKKEAAAQRTTGTTPAKKDPAPRDGFGRLIGKKSADMNVLLKSGKNTLDDVLAQMKDDGKEISRAYIQSHLANLRRQGHTVVINEKSHKIKITAAASE